jgi:hypothetical protein
MTNVLRIVLGLIGLLFLAMGIGAWIDTQPLQESMGLTPTSPLGIGTLRGDLAAFFLVGGGLSLAASIRRDGNLVTVPLMLIALTLIGRLYTQMTTYDPLLVQPIVAEAVITLVFAAAKFRGLRG